MSDYRKMMSAEERNELDMVLYESTHDSSGDKFPSAEFGDRLAALVDSAESKGRPWATWVRDAATGRGYYGIARDFLKARTVIHAGIGDRIVEKSAVVGIKRRDKEGKSYDQQVFWEELTRDQVQHVLRQAAKDATIARDRIAIARLLLSLLDETGLEAVPEALAAVGQTFDEFLIGDAA